MPVNYPKFDKKIQDQIDLTNLKASRTRPGTIMNFNRTTNTATIVLDEQFSDSTGNVVTNVLCPVTRGIQTVSPVIGSRCLVGFRDNTETTPYIINFFEDTVSKSHFLNNYTVRTGIPRYMVK